MDRQYWLDALKTIRNHIDQFAGLRLEYEGVTIEIADTRDLYTRVKQALTELEAVFDLRGTAIEYDRITVKLYRVFGKAD